jgi:3-oxoacyl-[acyl-carrier-protein] synthase-3
MHAVIGAIEYVLPEKSLTTEDLCAAFPEWSVEKIDRKTGITSRHIAGPSECASDLAAAAALKLFSSGACSRDEVDYLMLCTQSPDFALPTTACLLQHRLGLNKSVGALDFNLGCSGFVYGLGLAEGLIATRQARGVLLLTAETYSKYVNSSDKSARTIFGDGAAATFIRRCDCPIRSIDPFEYGTDGTGGEDIIVRNSGARRFATDAGYDTSNEALEDRRLTMNGQKVFEFAIKTAPMCVLSLLEKAHLTLDDIDLFVFHQANSFILEEIRHVLHIPKSKLQLTMSHCGNTVSSTIPIALKHAIIEKRLTSGSLVMVVGFGVGYSWAGAIIRWHAASTYD